MVPSLRLLPKNRAEVRGEGEYVLYWMIAARRGRWNFGLDRAIEWAEELGRPLVVLEALRTGYRWASDRFHRFILDGMRDNRRAFDGTPAFYYPYVEPQEGAGKGLLEALAERAAVVVTDEFPCFFLPRMVTAAAERLDVKLEAVDGNGLLPLQAADRVWTRAYDFRRYLQKELRPHLEAAPRRSPFSGVDLPSSDGPGGGILSRWEPASEALLEGEAGLESLPIDHDVPPVDYRGGYESGQRRLRQFVDDGLSRYEEESNQPGSGASSRLSPWLHFGHVGAHQVLDAVARATGWSPGDVTDQTSGKRNGWWGLDSSSEAFLDELVTWRELGHQFSFRRDDYAEYGSIPGWAQETLAEHEGDEREHVYSLDEFDRAETHDELWNAAQNQLRLDGRIHNYLRMLWGKKILHWTRRPRTAFDIMVELNNRYALDGRDPNSYSGILWVLGRFDRAWGPEREIFGKVRYMTSESTRRKYRVDDYIARWNGAG